MSLLTQHQQDLEQADRRPFGIPHADVPQTLTLGEQQFDDHLGTTRQGLPPALIGHHRTAGGLTWLAGITLNALSTMVLFQVAQVGKGLLKAASFRIPEGVSYAVIWAEADLGHDLYEDGPDEGDAFLTFENSLRLSWRLLPAADFDNIEVDLDLVPTVIDEVGVIVATGTNGVTDTAGTNNLAVKTEFGQPIARITKTEDGTILEPWQNSSRTHLAFEGFVPYPEIWRPTAVYPYPLS